VPLVPHCRRLAAAALQAANASPPPRAGTHYMLVPTVRREDASDGAGGLAIGSQGALFGLLPETTAGLFLPSRQGAEISGNWCKSTFFSVMNVLHCRVPT
jgi:hypothetical protein